MTDPLANLLRLRTTPPGLPPGFLERPRLEEKLTAAALGPLTVVSAGPGHGKTLTLASWVRRRSGGNVAWLALDDTDNDPEAFWSDLLGALTITGVIPLDSPLDDLTPAVRFDIHAARLISAGLLLPRCRWCWCWTTSTRSPTRGCSGRSNGCWIINRRSCTSSWPPVPTPITPTPGGRGIRGATRRSTRGDQGRDHPDQHRGSAAGPADRAAHSDPCRAARVVQLLPDAAAAGPHTVGVRRGDRPGLTPRLGRDC